MKENSKEIGFGTIGIIIAVVVVVLVGFGSWRIYDVNKSKTTTQTAANQDETPPKNQTSQLNPNEGYVVIKEWNVRFKPVEGLEGVEYFRPSGSEKDSFTFTTVAMANAASGCSPSSGGIVVGLVTRSKEVEPLYGGVLAKIGDYYYQYRGPQATCGAGDELESKIAPEISQSLKSLEVSQ